MSRQRQKGTALETAVVDYLSDVLEAEPGSIHRNALHGAQDRGDIYGLMLHGIPIAVECKNYASREHMSEWLAEAEAERGNIDGLAGVVVSKRNGIGLARPELLLVSMTLGDYASHFTGSRPTDGL